jgi:quercetin dioxygenase-like cupin family protein
MTAAEALRKYKDLGLKFSYEVDKPGKTYRPHAHEKVYLYCLKGSVKIKIDNKEWYELQPGQELIISKGQLHEAIVAPRRLVLSLCQIF